MCTSAFLAVISMRFFGAFFALSGDKRWQSLHLDRCAAENLHDQWSDSDRTQGQINPLCKSFR
jgi:hypothetical protein